MISEVWQIQLGSEDLLASAWHPNLNHLVVGNMEGEVFLVDPQSKRCSLKYNTIYGSTSALAFSPSGQMLAVGGTRSLKVVETLSGASLAELDDFGNDVVGLCFSPDERLLAVACHDGNLRVFTVKPLEIHQLMLTSSWRLLQKLCCGAWVQSVQFGHKEQLIWTVRSGSVKSMNPWNVSDFREFSRAGEFPICVGLGRSRILVGWGDGQISVHDFQLNLESLFKVDEDWIRGLHHLGDDHFVFTGLHGRVGVVSSEGFVVSQRERLHPGYVYSSSFQGSDLVICGQGNVAKFFTATRPV